MKKPKKVNFELIEDLESEPYKILQEMRKHHRDIGQAAIALASKLEIHGTIRPGWFVLALMSRTAEEFDTVPLEFEK